MTARRWSCKIAVPPSAVTDMIRKLLAVDAELQFKPRRQRNHHRPVLEISHERYLRRSLVGKLRPAATQLGGSLVVVRSKFEGLTPHLVWGGRTDATVLLEQIKRQFDPKNILNPGRFIYYF